MRRLPKPAEIEQAPDPARAAIEVLSRSLDDIARAVTDEDITGVLDLKNLAHVIQELTVQRVMGRGLELSATEFVRRTERAIGKVIRAGRERGAVRAHRDNGSPARQQLLDEKLIPSKPRPPPKPPPRTGHPERDQGLRVRAEIDLATTS